MPDRPLQPQRLPLAGLQAQRLVNLRNRVAVLMLGVLIFAALLATGGCGMSVKPRGQVVTDISVGR